jgi:cysteine desulfurase / selenocysteine lyase
VIPLRCEPKSRRCLITPAAASLWGVDVRDARVSFPGLEDKVFLDAATVSLAPVQACRAIEGFLERALLCPERDASTHHIAMDELRGAAVHEAAHLLGAGEDEIALVESTSHGLSIAARAIGLGPSDNIVIDDLEFLQVAIPWAKLVDEGALGEVRMARNVSGAVTIDSIAEQMDAHTRAVVVSSVQWSTGYRLDLAALSDLCRREEVFLIVDAVQELGALKMDVRRTPVDLLIAGGHKWLNAPFGCGILYVRRETQPQLAQTTWGYLGLEQPEGGWGTYFSTPSISPLRPYEFVPTAKRFELNGTANYPGAVGLGASLALLNAVGAERVEQRVLELAGLVREELEAAGVRIVSRPEPEARSGITTFTASGDPAEDEALLQRLLERRVYVSRRYTSYTGGIRVSTHYYNDETDVERLATAVRAALPRRHAAVRTH